MKKNTALIICIILFILAAGCSGINTTSPTSIRASGTISADQVNISTEIPGKVQTVQVDEGQPIRQGDVLFTLETQLVQAQYDQAAAALEAAKAAVQSAQKQYDLSLQNAQTADLKNRQNAWRGQVPTKFDLPIWYFQKTEKITAANQEIERLLQKYNQAIEEGKTILEGEKMQQLIELEKRIAASQITYQSAQDALNLAKAAIDNDALKDAAQDVLDDAEKELDQLQDQYDQLLTNKESDIVLEARAKIQAARSAYESAIDRRNQLLSGEHSLQVQAAEAVLNQAKAQQTQAEAALKVLQVQKEKCQVVSPLDGIVITRNLQAGESITPASTVMTIADLSKVNLVVYLPEEQYGKIFIGQAVKVTTDSYAGTSFWGKVNRIADQAEFTPRNVQTVEGRRSTVYAIRIVINNTDLKLKPGMPVDAEFEVQKTK